MRSRPDMRSESRWMHQIGQSYAQRLCNFEKMSEQDRPSLVRRGKTGICGVLDAPVSHTEKGGCASEASSGPEMPGIRDMPRKHGIPGPWRLSMGRRIVAHIGALQLFQSFFWQKKHLVPNELGRAASPSLHCLKVCGLRLSVHGERVFARCKTTRDGKSALVA